MGFINNVTKYNYTKFDLKFYTIINYYSTN